MRGTKACERSISTRHLEKEVDATRPDLADISADQGSFRAGGRPGRVTAEVAMTSGSRFSKSATIGCPRSLR